ncbi:MAG TPA: SEC-C metal-binding domain-containing protein [Rhizomicrobium sp.]|nr:SEC-C metal-binding domain-containing protein [Rhizomicrobium sp.]
MAVGPFELAQFGDKIRWSSSLNGAEFERHQEKLREAYPTVIEKIDNLVAEIATLVSQLPPTELLLRGWWEFAHERLTKKAGKFEDPIPMRMVDYVQSVIAGVPRSRTQLGEVSEENWKHLVEMVSKLFQCVCSEYQICNTAINKVQNPEYDDEMEELRVRAELMWCAVRGKRYQVHDIPALEELLLPHSTILEELFGITAKALLNELTKIWHSLTFGLDDAYRDLKRIQADFFNTLKTKKSGATDTNLPFELEEFAEDQSELQRKGQEAAEKLFGTSMFDLQKITNLPQNLLDEMSWGPGQEEDFFAAGPFKGWPQRVWPILKRPFIKLDERYYCFDNYSLFDNFYRVLQRAILRLKPEYQHRWNEIQQAISEEAPFNHLKKILPSGREIRPVWYRWRTSADQPAQWMELDGLYEYADHLFIIEVKAGSFTWTSPTTDLKSHIQSLKNLVQAPTRQGQRFLNYLKNTPSAPIYNKAHDEIGRVNFSKYRRVTICAVTLDSFGEIAAKSQHLRKVGIELGDTPVWSLSLDDMRVYADIFVNPLHFLHFVEQRQLALQSEKLELNDELDHLGLYLKHNNYSQYAAGMGGPADKLVFHAYTTDIDSFFGKKLINDKVISPLQQEVPARLSEVIDFLSHNDVARHASLSSKLLDMEGKWRTEMFGQLDQTLAISRNRNWPKPISSHGESEANVTLFLWAPPKLPRDRDFALEHTQALMLLNKEDDRTLLELSYDENDDLKDIWYENVSIKNLSAVEIRRLSERAEKLRQARIQAIKQTRKIGRNEQCPCGSGKKHKRCCLNRSPQ